MRRARLLVPPLLFAAACGTAPDVGRDPAAPEPQRLQVQAAGGEGELKAVQALLDAFEAAHGGVSVDFVGVPSQGDHIAKLGTAFAGGAPPDVFLLNYRRLGPFVKRGVVAPPSVTDAERADLYAAPLEAFTYDGRLACLPTNASSTVAYVNTALFARAGVALPEATWTWQALESTAQALAAKGVQAVGFDPEVRTVAPFTYTAGGDVVDDVREPTAMTLDAPPARAALDLLLRLQRTGLDATERAAQEPADAFAAGKVAIFFDSRRSTPAFRKAGLEFDVRPLPRLDAGSPSTSLLASDAYCVSKRSKSPRLAAELARFAVLGEGATVLAESGRTVPVRKSVASSPAFLAPGEAPASSQVWLDNLDSIKRLPNVAPQDEAEEAANDLLGQLFAGKLKLDEAVQRIRDETSAAYEHG